MQTLKAVVWLGTTLQELKTMPREVQRELGFVLQEVQDGGYTASIKSLSDMPGVYEIRSNSTEGTYRLVYVANLKDAIYVLHVFMKKSSKGIATPKRHMDIIRLRLSLAKEQSRELN